MHILAVNSEKPGKIEYLYKQARKRDITSAGVNDSRESSNWIFQEDSERLRFFKIRPVLPEILAEFLSHRRRASDPIGPSREK